MPESAERAERAEAVREVDWSAFEALFRSDEQLSSPPRLRAVSTLVAGVLWLVSLVLLMVTWNEVAKRSSVADQVPWLVSGGFVSIVLTVIGAAIYLGGGPNLGRGRSSGHPPAPPG